MEKSLLVFFQELVAAGISKHFHLHPFDADSAAERANYSGLDVYYVVALADRVVGYAMLRGWDAGYVVPSLGVALHPSVHGIGLGRTLMHVLHGEARRRGAPRIRLKVYPDNLSAVRLYRSLGYDFDDQLDHGQLVGHKQLCTAKAFSTPD
jgi:ribosomal protein S18 acetylase RimI-like enzyme